jgi:hypothetical protein
VPALVGMAIALSRVGSRTTGCLDDGMQPGRADQGTAWQWTETNAPAAGLLPGHRIVSFYGNPRSARMGILGALPPDSMLKRLRAQAAEYARADPSTPVLAAPLVEEVAGWGARDSLLLFLDIQPGRSPVVNEVRAYLDFLERPNVHLALDPEFAMAPGQVPGRVIGSLDAADANLVIELLANLVETRGLPPKILIVHRFTERMLTGHDRIRLDPRVQVVITMDGFGAPFLKRDSYRCFVASQPVEFTGFKLFYRQDVPLMSAADVLALRPAPLVVVYQ